MTNESVSGEMSIFCYLPKTLHSHSINPACTLPAPKSLHYKPENITASTLLQTHHWYVRSINISSQSLDSWTGLWTNEQRLPQQNARVLDTCKQLRRTLLRAGSGKTSKCEQQMKVTFRKDEEGMLTNGDVNVISQCSRRSQHWSILSLKNDAPSVFIKTNDFIG